LRDIAYSDVIVIHLGVAVVELQNIKIPRPIAALALIVPLGKKGGSRGSTALRQ
jgi:hypothetical protein